MRLSKGFSQLPALILLMGWGIFSSCEKPQELQPSVTSSFNEGWEFVKDGAKDWVKVTVPHTPKVEPLVVNDQWQGACTYRKVFTLKKAENEKVWIEFEGVMSNATVFLNGQKLTNHKGGYLPFVVDISDQLTDGENELKVNVLNVDDPTIPPGKALDVLDFNTFGGIYRDVNLIRKQKLYITHPVAADKPAGGGLLVHFDKVSKTVAEGILKVHVKNEFDEEQTVQAIARLTDKEGKETIFQTEEKAMAAGSDQEFLLQLEVQNPKLWNLQDPQLYELQVELVSNGQQVDIEKERIGIRKIRLTSEGLFLNDERIFVTGTNRHQEYPYVGYAISENSNWRDAVKIKNAGFDFVRLSHYPQDESFMEACDELGLILMDAIPGWQFFAEGQFSENAIRDIRDMVRRDRNHPSVFFWEVSLNESPMTPEFMEKANNVLKEELPFEDTYSAGWMDHPSYDLFIPARQHSKPPHYWNNYKDGQRNVFISEYGDWEYYAQNAGFNQTAFEGLKEEERTSRQLRGAGEKRLLQQALNYQEASNSNLRGKVLGTIGMSNWLMFDYNRGYANDIESSGISDIFRIPKFAHDFYKSQRPADQKVHHGMVEQGPMVSIASHWNQESETTVRVFSNCEEVALYLNGALVEKKKPTVNAMSDQLQAPPFEFDLQEFKAGELEAKGYINGEVVATDVVTTAGEVANLAVSIDYSGIPLSNEKQDLVFVYAKAVDSNGNYNAEFEGEVKFELEGKGMLIGQNPVKAEAGIASILYRSVPNDTTFQIKATSYELEATSK
ncbi:glycoside hydrolase family 2 TIM barrel-domain containing protein [Limibacter armeniacum]|uniref:glycoside hydrolase family 2 TIM barrel-domain containing protein n=1 Tax=Limibacter armeniacum TaxID=466084 RepID=UPI002FE6A49E